MALNSELLKLFYNKYGHYYPTKFVHRGFDSITYMHGLERVSTEKY